MRNCKISMGFSSEFLQLPYEEKYDFVLCLFNSPMVYTFKQIFIENYFQRPIFFVEKSRNDYFYEYFRTI